jgi:pyridoxamine--pyruvate transaminase
VNDQENDTPVFWLTTGPVAAYPQVSQGLSRPVLYDDDPVFRVRYETLTRKLRTALRTSTMPVIMQGEPVLGLEAAAASLIAKDDVVLNLVSGVYGDGYGYWARRYCRELVEIRVPYNEVIDPARVEAVLKSRPDIKVVSMCHHDTPSGTINPAVEIGRVVAAHGGYLVIDAVSSFGGMNIHPEDCAADIFVTAPQKCLGCPPGLTIMSVTDRAWARMHANPLAPRASFLSIIDWQNAWKRDQPFPFTPSIAEINGLEAAVDLYLEEGPEQVWARHGLTSAACRAGVQAMGLSLWAAQERFASPTATAVRIPPGVDAAALLKAVRANYGVLFSSGSGETEGKLVLIGHMGPNARPIYAIVAVAALGGALASIGHTVDVGAGVKAAMAVIDRGH